MKMRMPLCLPLVVFCFSVMPNVSMAQITWEANGLTNFGPSPWAPASSPSYLTISGWTRGSGLTTAGTAASRAFGADGWNAAADFSTAITNNDFLSFSATVIGDNPASFTSISAFNYRRSSTGPSSGQLQYSLNGTTFTNIGTTINYNNNTTSGASLSSTDLSMISDLQNVASGTTVTFRLANFGSTSVAGTWYIYDVGNNALSPDFSIATVPEPTAIIGLATLGLSLLRFNRGRPKKPCSNLIL
jgi:hypothetical protein